MPRNQAPARGVVRTPNVARHFLARNMALVLPGKGGAGATGSSPTHLLDSSLGPFSCLCCCFPRRLEGRSEDRSQSTLICIPTLHHLGRRLAFFSSNIYSILY